MSMMNPMNIKKIKLMEFSGLHILNLRQKRGLTRDEAASGIGVKSRTLKSWELEEKTPRQKGLAKVNQFYGLNLYLPAKDDE